VFFFLMAKKFFSDFALEDIQGRASNP